MYYDNDGKFYIEPEPEEYEGYDTYFTDLGNQDAAVILDPECVGPMFIFSTASKYGQDKSAMLDAMIALREAADTLTATEKLTFQGFFFNNGYIYKWPNGNYHVASDYFPMASKAPAKVELCMN